MLLQAPHFVHGVLEDILVRRLKTQRDLEFVHEGHRVLELVAAQQVGERLDDDLVAAVAEFLQDSLPDVGRDLVVVEEVPGRVDFHHRLPLMFLQDDVELMADVCRSDFLCDIVHVAAHRATTRARPVTPAGAEDDDPRVDDFAMEEIFLGPRGDVLPRVELAGASFVLHDLLEPHGPAPNVPAGENLCGLSAGRAPPTSP